MKYIVKANPLNNILIVFIPLLVIYKYLSSVEIHIYHVLFIVFWIIFILVIFAFWCFSIGFEKNILFFNYPFNIMRSKYFELNKIEKIELRSLGRGPKEISFYYNNDKVGIAFSATPAEFEALRTFLVSQGKEVEVIE